MKGFGSLQQHLVCCIITTVVRLEGRRVRPGASFVRVVYVCATFIPQGSAARPNQPVYLRTCVPYTGNPSVVLSGCCCSCVSAAHVRCCNPTDLLPLAREQTCSDVDGATNTFCCTVLCCEAPSRVVCSSCGCVVFAARALLSNLTSNTVVVERCTAFVCSA